MAHHALGRAAGPFGVEGVNSAERPEPARPAADRAGTVTRPIPVRPTGLAAMVAMAEVAMAVTAVVAMAATAAVVTPELRAAAR